VSWETNYSNDGFIRLDTGWVRISRIESIVPDEKRWGATASGKDLFRITITLISGATFTHLTTNIEKFMQTIAGVGS